MTNGLLWQEKVRRVEGGPELVKIIESMALNIEQIRKDMEELLSSAFPEGDLEEHRRYHQSVIERNEELRLLRMAIQEKTLSGIVWALLVFIGLAVWSSVVGKH